MATYKLRPRAVSDLREIGQWIAKDDARRDRTFIVELTEHFQRLAEQHIQHRQMTDLGPGVRRAVHGNYNIDYRFTGEHGGDVLIIRVLHGARDLSRIVFD